MIELPLIQPEGPKERADAARNRQRILDAAGALVAEQGIEAVSMDDVARAACVGTGTLYRRFGDRAGLAFALLDEQTRDFQNALLSGPPPLGPGAPARERLKAFGAVWAQAEVRKTMKASGAHVLDSELPVGMADYAFVEGEDALADPELTQRLKDLLGDLVREVTSPVEAS